MRFFIAIEIPNSLYPQIQVIQQNLKSLIPEARLTNLNKLHLTIAFVGEQPPELQPKLVQILQQACLNIPPFEVTPSLIDGFPNIHHPNILWLGVKGDIDKLQILREKVKDDLGSLNLPVDERRFIPHIAIAKLFNFNLTPQLESALQQLDTTQFPPIQVNSLKLFESIPNQGFHSHNTLAEIKLGY